MGPVAVGLVGGVFAAAQVNGFFLVNRKLDRFEVGVLVRAVAEGLVGGFATGAPEIVTGFQFCCERAFFGDNRFGHVFLLVVIIGIYHNNAAAK